MTIRATDRGVNPLTGKVDVTISITREGFPYFDHAIYNLTRSELTAVNTEIIQLEATDPLNVS